MRSMLLKSPHAAAHSRYTLLSVEPASAPGQILLRLATGASPAQLSGGTAYGPFPADEADARVQHVLERLRAAGYAEVGSYDGLIEQLSSLHSHRRALAAANLGWRRVVAAVPSLLALAATHPPEIATIVDALARIGDSRAIPLAREQAGKKLLSRRRSGVEALRALGDADGLALARSDGLQRLPPSLSVVLAGLDESSTAASEIDSLCAALDEVDGLRRGLALDQLYEFATPLCVAAVRRAVAVDWDAPHRWRYAKSIWRRAMLRGDVETFAQLALAFERRRARTSGRRDSLKSGLDGQTSSTLVFGARTQAYVGRASARWLLRLAYWRRDLYPSAASAVLRRYGPEDARAPRGLQSPFLYSLMLHRLMHANGRRQRVDAQSRVCFVDAGGASTPWRLGDVPFLDRFDAAPRAYIGLAVAPLDEVRALGIDGLMRYPGVIADADANELAALIDTPRVAAMASAEAERRFDVAAPDLELLAALLDAGELARRQAQAFLSRSATGWILHEQLPSLLRRRSDAGRQAIAQLTEAVLSALDADSRSAVLRCLVAAIRDGASDDDEALLAVLTRFADAAAETLPLLDVLALVQDGNLTQRALGGALLGAHRDALKLLGSSRLALLAEDEVQSVRAAAVALLERALPQLALDPWPLIQLAESRFADNRSQAFALLHRLGAAELSLDALVALCDSNRSDVQAVAIGIVTARLAEIDTVQLLQRLVEHPHRPMRELALSLVEQHWPSGVEAFARLAPFLRSSLLMPRLGRTAKERLFAIVGARGASDEAHATIAAEILGAALRTTQQRDFEAIAALLLRLQQQFPTVSSEFRVAA
jgi:hypothetical protein